MIAFRILPEEKLIILVNFTKLTVDELLAFRQELRQAPDYSEEFDILNDVRKLPIQYTADEIQQMAQQDYSTRKVAIIASSDFAFGMSRMWEMLSADDTDSNIRVFRNGIAALDWLEKDAADILPILDALARSQDPRQS
ncbi:MAG: hypothetical protein GY835_13705 [bacterium]|nr:hypothetical protein [bacterium]